MDKPDLTFKAELTAPFEIHPAHGKVRKVKKVKFSESIKRERLISYPTISPNEGQ